MVTKQFSINLAKGDAKIKRERHSNYNLRIHNPQPSQVMVLIDSLVVDGSKTCSLFDLLDLLSVLTMGNFQPILINSENQVVDGNKRLLVAIMKGWNQVPAVKEGGYGVIDLDFMCNPLKKIA
jgi:hypothetical protein